MEVIKIRLQAQHHSMADPLDIPKYRNAAHALYTVVKEEGIGALYRGVSLTALRQGEFLLFLKIGKRRVLRENQAPTKQLISPRTLNLKSYCKSGNRNTPTRQSLPIRLP